MFRAKRIYPAIGLVMLMFAGLAAQAAQGPRELIQERVERLTSRIEANREKLENSETFAREVVREEIVDLVDFKRITRLVMARHFSEASREQKYRFLDVFKSSLINTYASGLTLYQGQDIRILPMEEGDLQENRARVAMEISTAEGKTIPISYSLFRNGDGEWKVQNVIVNGLNLGKTFRAQFDQSVQQYGGDLDQVIANWSTELDVDGDGDTEDAGETGGTDQAAAGE
jgi:phospholipid transport system substrate-binding protein